MVRVRESHLAGEPTRHVALDLRRPGQARGGMHDQVAIGAPQHRVQARQQLVQLEPFAHHLVRTRAEGFVEGVIGVGR